MRKVNQTAVRFIVIQALPKAFWAKLDAIVPFDWENDRIPATFEIQAGKTDDARSFGLYVDGLFGIGTDRPYDWGIGIGTQIQLLTQLERSTSFSVSANV